MCHPIHGKEPITNISKKIFPEKELRGHSPNFHSHVSVSNLYLPTINLPIAVGKKIGTEAAQFPEKEYINGIFVAVHRTI